MCVCCIPLNTGHNFYCTYSTYGLYMHIHLPYKPIKYLTNIALILNLVDIFVSGTCVAISCKVEVVVGCILACFCKKPVYICMCCTLTMGAIFECCSHICSSIYLNMCTMLPVALLMPIISYLVYDTRWIGGLTKVAIYPAPKGCSPCCSSSWSKGYKVANYLVNLQKTLVGLTKGTHNNPGHMQLSK